MGDKSGDITTVEISNAVYCVREPGDKFSVSPVAEHPEICADCSVSRGEEADSLTYPAEGWEEGLPIGVDLLAGANNCICCPDPMALAKACSKTGTSPCRHYQLFEYLRNHPGEVDIEFYKAMWRSPPVGYYGNCSIFFAELNKDVEEPEFKKGSIKSFHCFGPAYPQIYHAAPYDRQIPGLTHSFFEINLTDPTPKEVTNQAMLTAGSYLGEACIALDAKVHDLGGIDYQWEPQRQLIEEARAEFWMGRNYQLSAQLATGHEAMSLYTKAMTHLARAMAIAKQAYNGIKGYTYLEPACEPHPVDPPAPPKGGGKK